MTIAPWPTGLRLFALAATLALILATDAQALTTVDLGQGLTYLRVAENETDFGDLAPFSAAIIDLRGIKFAAPDAEKLAQTLAANATTKPRPLRLLLLDANTSSALTRTLATPPAGVLTLAPASANLPADLTLPITDDEEQNLREARTRSTPITQLLPAPGTKERRDEATLVQEHTNGTSSPEPTESDAPAVKPTEKTATPSPLTDHLLLRALQLHRAHLALKKT